MGAGKGQVRRLKSTSNAKVLVEKRPKPKYNFRDEVERGGPKEISQIAYDAERNTYLYTIVYKDTWHSVCYEDDVTPINSATPSKQEEHFKNCLHKIVVLRYRSELYEGNYGEVLKPLDGQRARITAVSIGGGFTLDFYEVDESQQAPGVRDFKFHKKDFQFLEETLKQQQEFINEMDCSNLNF